ncbi:MAG: hypothetical protein DCC71_05060 [Proteobacteria bacterium]|nr:MAG: hypothetical protein DCC71_05060 [Pseudomonadota bacterium]
MRPLRAFACVVALAAAAPQARAATPCDDGLALADTDALHGAAAIELCDVSNGESAGVAAAAYRAGDLATPLDQVTNGLIGVGVFDGFGTNVAPRRGARMLALATGTARAPGDPGYASNFSKGYTSTPPPGFPADVPGCPTASNLYDAAALVLELVAPDWAQSFSFDFRYYSRDYPEWVCTSYEDQFVVLTVPPRDGSIGGNVVFDAAAQPMTVNAAFMTVCEGCPDGYADLVGTGFESEGATPWLRTQVPVAPGEAFSLRFAVWDVGDAVNDTTVLLDDFRWSSAPVAGPVTLVAPEPGSLRIGGASLAALATLALRRTRCSARARTLHPQGESIR